MFRERSQAYFNVFFFLISSLSSGLPSLVYIAFFSIHLLYLFSLTLFFPTFLLLSVMSCLQFFIFTHISFNLPEFSFLLALSLSLLCLVCLSLFFPRKSFLVFLLYIAPHCFTRLLLFILLSVLQFLFFLSFPSSSTSFCSSKLSFSAVLLSSPLSLSL